MAKSLAASRSVQGLAPEPAAPIEHVARPEPEPGPARQAAARTTGIALAATGGGDGDSQLEKKWKAGEAQVTQLKEELKSAPPAAWGRR